MHPYIGHACIVTYTLRLCIGQYTSTYPGGYMNTNTTNNTMSYDVTVKVWAIYSSEDQICMEVFHVMFASYTEAAAYISDRYCSNESYSITEIDPPFVYETDSINPFDNDSYGEEAVTLTIKVWDMVLEKVKEVIEIQCFNKGEAEETMRDRYSSWETYSIK